MNLNFKGLPARGKDTPVTRERVCSLRRILKREWGDSLKRVAERLDVSPTLLKYIESGERPITPTVAKRVRALERDLAYVLRDADRLDAETLDWLLTTLEHHSAALLPQQKKRLAKLLKGD